MMQKVSILFILLTLAMLLIPGVVFGQAAPPILPDSPEQTPVDGGLGILAAAGGAYALKKIRDRNKD